LRFDRPFGGVIFCGSIVLLEACLLWFDPFEALSLRFDPFETCLLRSDPFGGVYFVVRSFWRRVFCGSIPPEACLLRFVPLGALSLRSDPFGGVSFAVRSFWRRVFCGSILPEACLLRFGPLGALSLRFGEAPKRKENVRQRGRIEMPQAQMPRAFFHQHTSANAIAPQCAKRHCCRGTNCDDGYRTYVGY
jgi:hypothetical protein